ncbi:MAG TPA: hypothetical protein VHK47_09705 [Polyangia bacterium]|jgi:hypothetical protein|nr:hypothetical protein [Polyangia bacterium]
MKTSWSLVGVVATLLSCGGGGGSGHVELSGKTPGEGAALAAGAVCRRQVQCGDVSILCMAGGAAGGSGSDASAASQTCTASITPVIYDDCFADAEPDIEKLLACTALTPADRDTLEGCFDALAAEPCVTQADADERARRLAMGVQPTPAEPPAACDLIEHPPAGCAGAPPTR